jgi:hypothetical protein
MIVDLVIIFNGHILFKGKKLLIDPFLFILLMMKLNDRGLLIALF